MAGSKGRNDRVRSTLTLNVLGYEDQDEWVALALEMDLRGYGHTFEDALNELREIVRTQIAFARFKGQPELILKPAESVYWRLFEQATRDRLQEFVLNSAPRNPNYEVGGLPLPPPRVAAKLPEFQRADG